MLVNLHLPDSEHYESAYGTYSGAGNNRRTQISRSLTRRAITQRKRGGQGGHPYMTSALIGLEHVVRHSLLCRSIPNAEAGVQNPEQFADVIYGWPESDKRPYFMRRRRRRQHGTTLFVRKIDLFIGSAAAAPAETIRGDSNITFPR